MSLRQMGQMYQKETIMKKILVIGVAALTIIAASPTKKVTVMEGAVMCPSQGDLVVLSTSGSIMPGCQRLAHDTQAVQVDSAGHGIIAVRAGNSAKWWVLEASVR